MLNKRDLDEQQALNRKCRAKNHGPEEYSNGIKQEKVARENA